MTEAVAAAHADNAIPAMVSCPAEVQVAPVVDATPMQRQPV
eukprot:CAMPEP_0119412422 /NCGR_PEP_ID=MMETSP1335-20130426/4875_1 /TAXON_ID=259385 /ORGANISM="Chrysoculter rhomboideus, Strain RCC1486" /LENGTH=40 /DNA_ID= /DNA_START= /DNA_END= /DNA_ORIENTATION=